MCIVCYDLAEKSVVGPMWQILGKGSEYISDPHLKIWEVVYTRSPHGRADNCNHSHSVQIDKQVVLMGRKISLTGIQERSNLGSFSTLSEKETTRLLPMCFAIRIVQAVQIVEYVPYLVWLHVYDGRMEALLGFGLDYG